MRRAKHFEDLPLGRGFWELPGGKVVDGEPLGAALLRELREEIGLSLSSSVEPQYLGSCVYTLESGTVRMRRTQQVFSLAAPQGWTIRLSPEHDRHVFVRRKAEVDQLVETTELRDFLRQYLST